MTIFGQIGVNDKCLVPEKYPIKDNILEEDEITGGYENIKEAINSQNRILLEMYLCSAEVEKVISQEDFNEMFKRQSRGFWREMLDRFEFTYHDIGIELNNYKFLKSKNGQPYTKLSEEELDKKNKIGLELKPKIEKMMLMIAQKLVEQNPNSIRDRSYLDNIKQHHLGDKSKDLLEANEKMVEWCNNPEGTEEFEEGGIKEVLIYNIKTGAILNILKLATHHYKESLKKGEEEKMVEYENKILSYAKNYFENIKEGTYYNTDRRDKMNWALRDFYIIAKKTKEEFGDEVLKNMMKFSPEEVKFKMSNYQDWFDRYYKK